MEKLFKLSPTLGLLAILLLCHGMMWAIALCVEGRWLEWNKQYYAFVYGDILLAVAFAFSLWANQRIGLPPTDHWSRSWWVHAIAFVMCLVVAVWRWAINDFPAYTVGQSASPSKLYHDTLFVAVGYLLFAVVAPLIGRSWLVIVPTVLVAVWLALGIVFDAKAGWKTSYAHVDHPWVVKDWVEHYVAPLLARAGINPVP